MKITLCLVLVMFSVGLRAEEVDIWVAAQKNPSFDRALAALADLERPWTVPKLLAVFDKECTAWAAKYGPHGSAPATETSDHIVKEDDRCGYLADLLAFSRDPRVVAPLLHASDKANGSFSGTIHAAMGLQRYFLNDHRYHQPPPENRGPFASGITTFDITERAVRVWWELNKKELDNLPATATSAAGR